MKIKGIISAAAVAALLLGAAGTLGGCSRDKTSSLQSDIRSNISSMTSKVESVFDGNPSADSSNSESK